MLVILLLMLMLLVPGSSCSGEAELEEGPLAFGGVTPFFFPHRVTWVHPVSELGGFSGSGAEWVELVASITTSFGGFSLVVSDVVAVGFL